MKVQTNTGEVELTAEMVCRGMVLQSDHWIQNAARDGVLTMLRADPARPECWEATVDESWCYPVNAQRFLGCDPTIASRADCERYGVHGDAAAHGFARLRDGGAVDFRREELPNGSAVGFIGGTGRCYSVLRSLTAEERFVGLNLNYANPSDVRRLCCLESREQGSSLFCTLAIGDHAEHEDLATGVKWSAGAERYLSDAKPRDDFNASLRAVAAGAAKGLRAACPNCGGDDATCRGSLAGLKACAAKGKFRPGLRCDEALDWTWADPASGVLPPSVLVFHGSDGEAAVNRVKIGDAGFSCACGATSPAEHRNGCEAEWWIRQASAEAWRVYRMTMSVGDAGRAGTHAASGACVVEFFAGLKRWAESAASRGCAKCPAGTNNHPGEMHPPSGGWRTAEQIDREVSERGRRNREAPLVALVAAVPEGLDPIGWRAAVLAVDEAHPESDRDRRVRADGQIADKAGQWLCAHVGKPCDLPNWSVNRRMHDAYHRAISPAPKVDRVRATWKTRGPVLPCDNGEDE